MALVYVSPGLYRDSKTGKLIKSTTGKKPDAAKPGANKPANKKPAFGKAPTGIIKKEFQQQKRLAEENRKLGNINTVGPTGSTMFERDPVTGEVTQKVVAEPGQQKIYDVGTELTQQGQQLAQQQMAKYQPYGPDTAYNQAVINSVFSQLTQGVTDQEQREKAELEQTLYNRGIPLNPADPQYKAHMDAFNKKYQDIYGNAKMQAVQQGSTMGLAGHQQNMSDLAALQNQGTGLMLPTAPGYNAPQMQITSPVEYDIAMQTLKTKAGGGAAPVEESPFMNSLPPGYSSAA